MGNDTSIKRKRGRTKIVPSATGGKQLEHGDMSPKFQSFLDRMGINKGEILKQFEEQNASMAENIIRRSVGLKVYRAVVDPLITYYQEVHKRGLSMHEDAMLLEMDLIDYRQRMEKDPEWNPIADKVYQDGLERKAKMLQYINRFNLDYAKLKAEVQRKGYDTSDVVTVDQMNVQGGDTDDDS